MNSLVLKAEEHQKLSDVSISKSRWTSKNSGVTLKGVSGDDEDDKRKCLRHPKPYPAGLEIAMSC